MQFDKSHWIGKTMFWLGIVIYIPLFWYDSANGLFPFHEDVMPTQTLIGYCTIGLMIGYQYMIAPSISDFIGLTVKENVK